MRVLNKGLEPFSFTAALHSYFEVAGIENARVSGLKGLVRACVSYAFLSESDFHTSALYAAELSG